ncbi:Hypothetical Protein OBI_RACECAR_172 [Arthrobacter phage Racecar]|nr:hypothetical protein PBI_RACECAR_254 [Arthrobacter phage Racecar]QFG12893.1 hypothetical protein PBI_MIMI_251 [Arthrobacter phage Mimi]
MTTTQTEQVSDNYEEVNTPKHYRSHPSGVECIEITRHMSFNLGNAFKYIWRADLKHDDGGIIDLEKAEFYIKDEIAKRKAEKAKKQAETPSLIVNGSISADKLSNGPIINVQVHPASGLSTDEAEKLIADAAVRELNHQILSR